jgi:heme oxygenase
MGDLSGGQILKKVVQNHYLQDENKGFSFYIFPIDNISILKNSYKDSLNSIQLTEEEQKEVIQESISAFEYNYKLFQELEKI